MKHTATPWRVTGGTTIKEDCRPISDSGVLITSVCGYTGSGFFPTDEEAVANAAFIVRACNAHDQLVAVLHELHTLVWGECPSLLNEDSGGCARLDVEIRAALAAAGAE